MKYLFLLFILTTVNLKPAKAQSFSCNLLNLIVESFESQIVKHNLYMSIKDSIKLIPDKVQGYRLINNSNYSYKIADSLVKFCNYRFIFNDSLFNCKNKIILIDTFGFFENNCVLSKKLEIDVVSNINAKDLIDSSINYVKLKSIRSYNNCFIISLQHIKSSFEVEFNFVLVANISPKLIEIYKNFPLYDY